MSDLSEGRLDAVRDLVELSGSLRSALERLREYPWDIDHALVTLTANHVRGALDRLGEGHLSESDIVDWAEAVLGREDLDLDATDRERLAQVLFEMSTPELFGPVSAGIDGLRDRLR